LGQVACSGIVYCLSRKEAESLAQVLREQGRISASHYHAGMTPRQRTEVRPSAAVMFTVEPRSCE
jgi:bloom syndrome protein